MIECVEKCHSQSLLREKPANFLIIVFSVDVALTLAIVLSGFNQFLQLVYLILMFFLHLRLWHKNLHDDFHE